MFGQCDRQASATCLHAASPGAACTPQSLWHAVYAACAAVVHAMSVGAHSLNAAVRAFTHWTVHSFASAWTGFSHTVRRVVMHVVAQVTPAPGAKQSATLRS